MIIWSQTWSQTPHNLDTKGTQGMIACVSELCNCKNNKKAPERTVPAAALSPRSHSSTLTISLSYFKQTFLFKYSIFSFKYKNCTLHWLFQVDWLLFLLLFCFFWDTVSLWNSPGCFGTRFVDKVGLELTEIHLPLPPQVLGLKIHITIAWPGDWLLFT